MEEVRGANFSREIFFSSRLKRPLPMEINHEAKVNPASLTSEEAIEDENQNSIQRKRLKWVAKVGTQDEEEISKEVFSAEFQRMILPNHPKTKLAYIPPEDAEDNESLLLGVAARRLEDFELLTQYDFNEVGKKIESGEWMGMGYILVLSLILDETDLKWDNIAIKDNRFVKMDFDNAFDVELSNSGDLRDKPSFDVEDLEALPDLAQFPAFNWFSYVIHGQRVEDSKQNIFRCPRLIAEINECILKLLLLPKEFTAAFLRSCGIKKTSGASIDQKFHFNLIHLRIAALKSDSFRKYMQDAYNPEKVDNYIFDVTKHVVQKDFQPSAEIRYPVYQMQDLASQLKTECAALEPVAESKSESKPVRVVAVPTPVRLPILPVYPSYLTRLGFVSGINPIPARPKSGDKTDQLFSRKF